jgi:protein disulfide-isomerase A6
MALLPFLLASIASDYIEFTTENVDDYMGSTRPVFVKFYSPYCGHCQAIHPHFVEASTKFPGAVFGGIDCTNQKSLCERFRVETYPNIRLFIPGSSEIIDYDGDYSTQSLIDFVDMQTDFPPKRVSTRLVTLDPTKLDKLTDSSACGVVFFYGSQLYRHELGQFGEAAAAFDADENVTFGTIACESYLPSCANFGFEELPILKLFKKGTQVSYDRLKFAPIIVDFVNEKCETSRGIDGLLADTAGTIPEADRLVKDFLNANDQKSIIEKVKAIPGAEFYAQAMERYIAKGKQATEKDVASMWAIIAERKGSPATIDRLKLRYNVLKQFVTTEESVEQEI